MFSKVYRSNDAINLWFRMCVTSPDQSKALGGVREGDPYSDTLFMVFNPLTGDVTAFKKMRYGGSSFAYN